MHTNGNTSWEIGANKLSSTKLYPSFTTAEIESQFRQAMLAAGLNYSGEIVANGAIHRFSTNGSKSDQAGWYVLYDDNIPAGSFGDWRTGLSQNWCADIGRELTHEEENASRKRMSEIQRKRDEEKARIHQRAKINANEIWNKAIPAAEHPYLAHKRIKAHGIRVYEKKLIIPLCNESGEICSLQFIDAAGSKKFMPDGQVKDCYYTIGRASGVICVAEGFATAASIHEATGYTVIVAFNAGKLLDAAKFALNKFPDTKIIICADDDYQTEGNPGRTKANEAAQSVNGYVVIPDFGDKRPDGFTDFNDLHQAHGIGAVHRCVTGAITTLGREWPSPEPLVSRLAIEPYPVDALPQTILNAVEEVQSFTKAPLPLIASSAISAISLASQAHVDVQRDGKLKSPSGLFLLTIADSGERKSTCDDFFTVAIKEYEKEQEEASKGAIDAYDAAILVWDSEKKGITEAIRNNAKSGKSSDRLKKALKDLQNDKPESPLIPRLNFSDVTPEELAYSLSKKWPSGGIVSSEAGVVFGSHGMGKDSVMRNLSLLNQLWDGGTIRIDRRTSESFAVRGARLTIALQVQEATLKQFFDRSGDLARGTGFLARFLISWPESTQGQRPYTNPPLNWPAMTVFNRRIKAILDRQVPLSSNRELTPRILQFAPEAKTEWVNFYNNIEENLRPCGELFDIRDVASKAADNVARLAALFQYFEKDSVTIEAHSVVSASAIVAWHLNESRRFFGELSLPLEISDAMRLDKWTIEYCKQNKTHMVNKNHIRQYSPLRKTDRLNNAIAELTNLNRIQLTNEGKKAIIKVNPGLL